MTASGPTILRSPVPRGLRDLVAGIVGFDETSPSSGRVRVQPAGTMLVLEVSFTTPLRIRRLEADVDTPTPFAFLAGLMLEPMRTWFVGRHASIQTYLTPLGAARLLGVPGSETASRVTPATELVPRWGRDLPDRLADASGWPQRFEIVRDELTTLAAQDHHLDGITAWVWSELQRTGGQARIADLANRSGWSTRHVTSRFEADVGVSPKAAAQVIRFERVHAEMWRMSERTPGRTGLADLAARFGFADQSHLTREVRRFSGDSPRALEQAQRPTPFTALGVSPDGVDLRGLRSREGET